jgi:hypothetical protein
MADDAVNLFANEHYFSCPAEDSLQRPPFRGQEKLGCRLKTFRDWLKSEVPEISSFPRANSAWAMFRVNTVKMSYGARVYQEVCHQPHEITFDQYDEFAKATGGQLPDDEGFGRGRRPVIRVSWNEAVDYAAWLSKQTGKRYRLPTEAEWEYVARAGTETAYWWGNEMKPANCIGCSGSPWDGKGTAPVGSFRAECVRALRYFRQRVGWVQDCRHESYQERRRTDRLGRKRWRRLWRAQDSQRHVRWAHNYVRSSSRMWNRAKLQLPRSRSFALSGID